MYQVIIVEDDPMVAEIDRQYVEMDSAFHVSRICKDGLEGLNWLEEHTADLIILDFYTPTMTGLEFVDRLHARGQYLPIIVVTSAGDTPIVQSLLARGVMDYLVKPFRYDRFKQALDRFRLSRNMPQGRMGQSDIDRLVGASREVKSQTLEKGLNSMTLERVRQFFRENPGQLFSGEQVAERLSLSRITIRRYVSFMVEGGEITSTVDYQTGGRPAVLYKLNAAGKEDTQ